MNITNEMTYAGHSVAKALGIVSNTPKVGDRYTRINPVTHTAHTLVIVKITDKRVSLRWDNERKAKSYKVSFLNELTAIK